jgi:hypothetical protein
MASASKKSLRAAERKRADVARARRRWIREQGWLDTTRLVFIDETAVTTNMLRLNGWNSRGERLFADAPMGHWETVTFIAGLRQTGDGLSNSKYDMPDLDIPCCGGLEVKRGS